MNIYPTFKKIIIKLIPWIIVFIVGVFFYKTLHENWHRLGEVSFDINSWTIAAIISFTFAVVLSGILWGRILADLSGSKIATADAVRIHCASWLLKYIPGQVGSYLNKIAWGSKHGISKKTISTSFIYENVLMVLAGFLLSTPIFWLFKDKLGEGVALLLPLLVIIPMLIITNRKVFYGLLNFVFTKLKKKPFKESDFLQTKSLLKYQTWYLFPRLLNGVGFVFIAISIFSIEPHMYVGLAATYILASIVGLLAIFVPGGIGVREAVIVLFASVYLPVEQAIILSLLTRFYVTISDIGVAIIYLVINKGNIKQL